MNRNFKIGGAILLLTLAIACSKKAEENSYAMDKAATVDSSSVADDMSSSAAVEDKNSKRKFIRTADTRFKVKDVAHSTYKIENVTKNCGGFERFPN